LQPGRTQQQSPTAASPERYVQCFLNSMQFYKRSIKKNSTGLKLLLIAIVCAILYSFFFHNYNLGYFSFVAFIFCSLFTFTGFEVSIDHFIIERHYFYSLIRKEWRFDRNANTKIIPFGLPFGYKDDVTFAEAETAVGCLLSIILFFTAKPKITHKRFTIEVCNKNGKIVKSVSLFLTEEEFNLIEKKAS